MYQLKLVACALISNILCYNAASNDSNLTLKTIENSLTQKEYKIALNQIKNLTDSVAGVYGTELAKKILPEQIDGLVLNKDQYQNSVKDNGLYVVRVYETPSVAESTESMKQIMISVTTNTDLHAEISDVHFSSQQVSEEGRKYQAVKVKDTYRALLVFDSKVQLGSLAVIVGAATVQIDGEGLTDVDILMKASGLINYQAIINEFGL